MGGGCGVMVPPQARAQSDTPVDQEGEQASAQAARESLGAGPPCGHLGSGRGGPEGAAQSRTGPRACLAKPCRLCQEPLCPTEVCVRRTPVHGHGAVPAQARPGTGQSVWRTRREWRHVWRVHTRERLHTHMAVRSTGSHGHRAAAGEGASLPVPWERSPRASRVVRHSCRLVPLQGAELERLSHRHAHVRSRPAGAGRQGPRGFKAQGRKPKQQKSRRDRDVR